MPSNNYLGKSRVEYDRLAGKLTAAPSVLRITSASNGLPAALGNGVYRIVADVDVYVRQCNATMTVATTNASLLPSGTIEFIGVTASARNIVGITGGGSGYLYATKLS